MYKLIANSTSIIRISDNAIIPNNPTLAAWQNYQDWLNEGNTPEPAGDPIKSNEINWLDFKAAFLGEPNWLAIASLFSNPDIRTGIVAAVGTSNAADFQDNYLLAIADLTAQQIPLDPAVSAGWQAIADANNIPINFEVGNG
jgi:hypothetical protein